MDLGLLSKKFNKCFYFKANWGDFFGFFSFHILVSLKANLGELFRINFFHTLFVLGGLGGLL
jgi:hypothetical protein